MKFIDLSVAIDEKTPVYPGDPVIKIQPAGNLEKDGYEDHLISIGTHVGTHIDAPRHMVVGGKSLKDIPLENFTGRGIHIKNENKQFDLEAIKRVNIQEGDIVLFETGMSQLYYQSEYFKDYPNITEEVANYLVEKRVKMLGVDTCSVDHDQFIAHKILLSQEILILENLTNLSELEGQDFMIYAFPLNLSLDGSPLRVVAQIL
jgi:arylformamidase